MGEIMAKNIITNLSKITLLTLFFLLSANVMAFGGHGGHGGGRGHAAFQGRGFERGGFYGHEGWYGREGFERNYVGFGFGFGPPFWGDPFWSPYPYYAPLYYPPAPTVVVTQPPSPPVTPQGTTYIPPNGMNSMPSSSAPAQNTGYFFCPDNKGIYPQVKTCPGAWQHLPLVPPGAVR